MTVEFLTRDLPDAGTGRLARAERAASFGRDVEKMIAQQVEERVAKEMAALKTNGDANPGDPGVPRKGVFGARTTWSRRAAPSEPPRRVNEKSRSDGENHGRTRSPSAPDLGESATSAARVGPDQHRVRRPGGGVLKSTTPPAQVPVRETETKSSPTCRNPRRRAAFVCATAARRRRRSARPSSSRACST